MPPKRLTADQRLKNTLKQAQDYLAIKGKRRSNPITTAKFLGFAPTRRGVPLTPSLTGDYKKLVEAEVIKRWAKDNAVGTGMGHQADWHQVDNAGQVAGYVAKYTLKNSTLEQGGIIWPKGLRRIETSRNWPKLSPKMKDENWAWIVYQSREFQLHQAKPYHEIGFTIIDKVKE